MDVALVGKKQELRHRLLDLILHHSPGEYLGSELDPYGDGVGLLLVYSPLNGEPDPKPFVEKALVKGLSVYYPRIVTPTTLEFRALTPEYPLVAGPYGIREPDSRAPLLDLRFPERRGIVLVPGLAFDRKGGRLGRGKGFYDRFLPRIPKEWKSFGLAQEFQLVDSVPLDSWDHRVDGVIIPGSVILPQG